MERLQVAVEKARAQRRSTLEAANAEAASQEAGPEAGDPGAGPQAARTDGAGDGVADAQAGTSPGAPAPQAGPGAQPRAAPQTELRAAPKSVAAAWQALRPLETQAKVLRRNRIVTFDGGPESTPYDLLRTKIIQQAQVNGWRRIAIVSSHSGCGKTTTTANLAFSLARQKDLRSLMIDLDLRRPALGQVMGQTSRFNMADVLERRVSFAEHGERYGDTLAFGFNNSSVRNPSEILQSQQTRDVLTEIEQAYGADLMLFDMPPMMASDDNFGFLKNVDAALLIAAAEKTPVSEIDVTERQLAALTNVMGIVLNKCNYVDGAYGYEYGYY